MADDRDLATDGAKDRLKSVAKRFKGRVRSTVGGATRDMGGQVEGKVQEIERGRISTGSERPTGKPIRGLVWTAPEAPTRETARRSQGRTICTMS